MNRILTSTGVTDGRGRSAGEPVRREQAGEAGSAQGGSLNQAAICFTSSVSSADA